MKVYYTSKMVADSGGMSPSPAKPKMVVEDWRKHGLDIEVVSPIPLGRNDFYRVHDMKYVNGVLDCKAPNGFGNRKEEIARTLQYTSGAMYWAAKAAIKGRTMVAALCSGFHHACWSHGGGFCTFNGLLIAAKRLYSEKLVRKVGILDCDCHYGNGTVDIIRKLKIKWIEHYSSGDIYGMRSDAKIFLRRLPEIIMDRFKGCDLVLYQAGADPHVSDPLGGWMTTEEMKERDRIVFQTLHKMGIPVAWNLSGGYSNTETILEIHRNTAMECLKVEMESEKEVA